MSELSVILNCMPKGSTPGKFSSFLCSFRIEKCIRVPRHPVSKGIALSDHASVRSVVSLSTILAAYLMGGYELRSRCGHSCAEHSIAVRSVISHPV